LRAGSVGDAVYFTFITGLTIGYGDIVPRQAFARALAIAIGVSGLFLTGVIAGIAVYAMRKALDDRDTDRGPARSRACEWRGLTVSLRPHDPGQHIEARQSLPARPVRAGAAQKRSAWQSVPR
jgi:Ion channel